MDIIQTNRKTWKSFITNHNDRKLHCSKDKFENGVLNFDIINESEVQRVIYIFNVILYKHAQNISSNITRESTV